MNSFLSPVITLPSSFKCDILIISDSLMLIFALWLSFSLRMENWYWSINNPIMMLILSAPLVAIPIFIQLGLYRVIIRYLNFKAFFLYLKLR